MFVCSFFIFITVPVARSLQQLVYETFGRAFFTYAVLLVILSVLCILIYVFLFILRIRGISQYAWLMVCAGIFVYLTIRLGRKHPEEAVHLLEYGLLAYFAFKALSCRIQDWTVYITAALFVSLMGIADEFVQWLLPSRVWDYKDVGINMLAGCIILLAINRGVRPQIVGRSVDPFSVKMLLGSISVVLIVLSLCLSNTPENVTRYTSLFESLAWLRSEEPMTKSGALPMSLFSMWTSIICLLVFVRIFLGMWARRLEE